MKTCKTQINPKKSSQCKSCGLYINQFPISDSKKEAEVFWVGLSAVQVDENEEFKIPLSPSTKSGKLIQDIELACGSDVSFFKTNLVKCLPLNEKKIRYPERIEMNKCYPNLEAEMDRYKPKVVFLLGRLVAEFTLKKYGIRLGGLGSDFSDVKIHANSSKAPDIGALAYTQGSDIHFAPGQFKPDTTGGQQLLGHELTHVVQQREGRVKPTTEVNGMPVNDNPGLENEADVMGAKLAQAKMEDDKVKI